MDRYTSIFSNRYASQEMSSLFSPRFKYITWRNLWIALAKAQKALGLDITKEQIEEMEQKKDHLDLKKVEEYEKKFGHDVMAHLHAFADECQKARGIIHLGATSCYVTDNTDLIQMREGLKHLKHKLLQVIRNLNAFAEQYASCACLSYTHFQPAQPTTVGKRACLWLQDFVEDFKEIDRFLKNLKFLGVKGATGTQASFLSLFEGDYKKVKQLEELVAHEMKMDHLFSVSGQTYSRKQDIHLFSLLASFGASAHKFGNDIRLLAHLQEIEEPFSSKQIGSSAMPYKRNPMRSERICSLSRFLISLNENPLYTAATQWLERSLDDSANRRISLPEAFLCADAVLTLLCYVTKGLKVYPKVIEKNLKKELPFFATEIILIAATKKGKDRQKVHERLRMHSLASAQALKEEGKETDLFSQITSDQEIGVSFDEIKDQLKAESFIGCAVLQTKDFLQKEIAPLLKQQEHIPPFIPEILV